MSFCSNLLVTELTQGTVPCAKLGTVLKYGGSFLESMIN